VGGRRGEKGLGEKSAAKSAAWEGLERSKSKGAAQQVGRPRRGGGRKGRERGAQRGGNRGRGAQKLPEGGGGRQWAGTWDLKRSGSGTGKGSLEDETGKIGGESEGIANDHGFGRVGKAEPGGTFQVAVLLGGIAGFGIALAAHAELPEIGADLGIASQADGAIREGEANGDGKAEGLIGVGKGTGLAGRLVVRVVGDGEIGVGLVKAFLAADPLGRLAVVIVAIGSEAVTMRTEGVPGIIIATRQTSEGVRIDFVGAWSDGAQGVQIGKNEGEDLIKAFPGIGQDLADLEIREAAAQGFEAWNSEEMIVEIGRRAGTGQGPEEGEAIIDDIEGFGFVTEMMFAA